MDWPELNRSYNSLITPFQHEAVPGSGPVQCGREGFFTCTRKNYPELISSTSPTGTLGLFRSNTNFGFQDEGDGWPWYNRFLKLYSVRSSFGMYNMENLVPWILGSNHSSPQHVDSASGVRDQFRLTNHLGPDRAQNWAWIHHFCLIRASDSISRLDCSRFPTVSRSKSLVKKHDPSYAWLHVPDGKLVAY